MTLGLKPFTKFSMPCNFYTINLQSTQVSKQLLNMFISFGMNKANAWGEGGVVPLCKPNRYRPPQSVGFWGPPLVWNGYILCLFWSEIRYGFQGNYGSVLEHIYHFSSKWLRKKEKQENFKWIWKTLCHFPQCIAFIPEFCGSWKSSATEKAAQGSIIHLHHAVWV